MFLLDFPSSFLLSVTGKNRFTIFWHYLEGLKFIEGMLSEVCLIITPFSLHISEKF